MAYEQFKKESYLQAAIKCGHALWYRGILLKGNGLCHGITGNIYPLLYLAKITKDNSWKQKAYLLTRLTYKPEIID
jgi:lantibiotic modifying enzyme